MPSQFEKDLAEIASPENELSYALLSRLSGLNQPENAGVGKVFRALPEEKRQQLIFRLVQMAEENPHLDFTEIFRRALHDAAPQIRSKAIEGLWEDETLSMAYRLLSLFEKDPAPEVRAAAAIALGKFALLAETGALPVDFKAQLAKILLSAFADPHQPPGSTPPGPGSQRPP